MGNKVGGQSQSEEETEVVVPAARVPPLSAHPGESLFCNFCGLKWSSSCTFHTYRHFVISLVTCSSLVTFEEF